MVDDDALRARDNELTAVGHRDLFDALPSLVTNLGDVARWYDFRHRYHRAQQLLDFEPFPLQVDFELNSLCNLRCAFCIHGHERVPKRLMPFTTFKRVIDEGEKHGLCSIKLNYINEPLMRTDVDAFVRYARDHGVLNVYFATNGTLLNDATARKLIDCGVTKIMVSIDAVTPATFIAMRGRDDYGDIVRNIEHLLDLRLILGVGHPLVRVNFLKSRLNIHEAEAFRARWEHVADSVAFQDQVALPGIEEETYRLHPTDATFRCSFPFKLVVIDSAGHILPCCTFSGREMPLGSIDEMTVHDAWNSPRMMELKHLQQRGAYRDNAVCRHCIHGTTEEKP